MLKRNAKEFAESQVNTHILCGRNESENVKRKKNAYQRLRGQIEKLWSENGGCKKAKEDKPGDY